MGGVVTGGLVSLIREMLEEVVGGGGLGSTPSLGTLLMVKEVCCPLWVRTTLDTSMTSGLTDGGSAGLRISLHLGS